jgi:tetratricopeptide (TPR) repeat protein
MAYATAAGLLREALDVARAIGDRWLVQTTLSQLGHVAHGSGDLEAARRFFAESLSLARALDDPEQTAQLLHNAGVAASDAGDQEGARRVLRESLVLFRRNGQRFHVAMAVDALAGVSAAEGDAERALRLAGAAAAIRRRTGIDYWPFDRARRDRRLAPAFAALPEPRAADAFTAGELLADEDAVAAALEV